jgi:very-short-patch-repair endonuclease
MGFRATSFVMSREQWTETFKLARAFRLGSSMPEQLLWNELRCRKFQGTKFRRQHPIGPYIVDFYAPQHRLAIEVDGPFHQDRRLRDEFRQRLIELQGIRFLRLESSAVETDMTACLAAIGSALASAHTPKPPFPEGKGASPEE